MVFMLYVFNCLRMQLAGRSDRTRLRSARTSAGPWGWCAGWMLGITGAARHATVFREVPVSTDTKAPGICRIFDASIVTVITVINDR